MSLSAALCTICGGSNRAVDISMDEEGSPEFVIDARGVLVKVNDAAAHYLGYQASELVGKPLNDLLQRESGDRTTWPAEVSFIDGVFAASLTIRLRHKEGHDANTRMTIRPNLRSAGTAACIRPLNLQALEAELREATEIAKNRSVFLSRLSHEIRTPLNSIVAGTDLLVHSSGLSAEQRDILRTIELGCEMTSSVINDVLDFSCIDAGKLTLASKPFSLQSVINEVVEVSQPIAVGKGIKIELRQSPVLAALVIGDRSRFRRVLLNLGECDGGARVLPKSPDCVRACIPSPLSCMQSPTRSSSRVVAAWRLAATIRSLTHRP
jgi:signal transduction histidine kinase